MCGSLLWVDQSRSRPAQAHKTAPSSHFLASVPEIRTGADWTKNFGGPLGRAITTDFQGFRSKLTQILSSGSTSRPAALASLEQTASPEETPLVVRVGSDAWSVPSLRSHANRAASRHLKSPELLPDFARGELIAGLQ